ncbi:hypothetical protein SLA_5989 [Streptomyces laurentii]|uniref:Lipoprotein n=1 Tax=Streptomyces laurentii TaxID=39478 RepID=A0A169P8J0_STRLU|nr:hypothetical protein SLA_5989 [Streptomyces laurentii]
MRVATALTVLTVAACGGPDGGSGGGKDTTLVPCAVRHETDQVTARFPSFGPLRSTSWCDRWHDYGERGVPGPTDVRMVGILDPVDDRAVRDDLADPTLAFEPATPAGLPAEIEKLLPEDAEWRVSEPVSRRLTEERYSGTFFYDARSGQVLFDCVNPRRKDEPPPKVVTN